MNFTAEQLRDASQDALAWDELLAFAFRAWAVLEPQRPVIQGWHFAAICRELQRLQRREIHRLVINIPPGMAKSMLVSAIFPSWVWLHTPHERLITVSNDPSVVNRDADRQRLLTLSPWYQRQISMAFERRRIPFWGMRKDQDARVNFGNTQGGYRLARAYHGAVTGHRADTVIVDDPIDEKDLVGSPDQVERRMEEAVRIWEDTLDSRIEPKTGVAILIMQRLHPEDLAGHLIRQGWPVLCLPQRYEPDHPHASPLDPRKPGEFILPDRFAEKEWADLHKKRNGGQRAAGQHQQRPERPGSKIFKTVYWERRYPAHPDRQARDCEEILLSFDGSFKDAKTSSFTAVTAWGKKAHLKYLLGMARSQVDLIGALTLFRDFAARFPRARIRLIEAKANGESILSMMRGHVPGLVAVNPLAGKYERAQLAATEFDLAHVYLPTAQNAPWIREWIDEHERFPQGEKNDLVDTTSQAIGYWLSRDEAGSDDEIIARIKRSFSFLGRG